MSDSRKRRYGSPWLPADDRKMTYAAGPPPHKRRICGCRFSELELEEVRVMAIVGALDIHRQQLTFDWVNHASGESGRGRISPADRAGFRKWLGQLPGESVESVEIVVEGCTG
jgi:hypothetical protein